MTTDSISVVTADADSARVTLLDRVERDLAGVTTVLARLDAGTFGQCEQCSSPIGENRLSESALAIRCDACAGGAVSREPAPTEPAPIEPD